MLVYKRIPSSPILDIKICFTSCLSSTFPRCLSPIIFSCAWRHLEAFFFVDFFPFLSPLFFSYSSDAILPFLWSCCVLLASESARRGAFHSFFSFFSPIQIKSSNLFINFFSNFPHSFYCWNFFSRVFENARARRFSRTCSRLPIYFPLRSCGVIESC